MVISTLSSGSVLALGVDFLDRHDSMLVDADIDTEFFNAVEYSLDDLTDSSASSPMDVSGDQASWASAVVADVAVKPATWVSPDFNIPTPPSMSASAAASPGREERESERLSGDLESWTTDLLLNRTNVADECDTEIIEAFPEANMWESVGNYAFSFFPTAPPSPVLIAPISLDDADDLARETMHPTECFKLSSAAADEKPRVLSQTAKAAPTPAATAATAAAAVQAHPGAKGGVSSTAVPTAPTAHTPLAHQPQPPSVSQRMVQQQQHVTQRPHQPRPHQLSAAVAAAAAHAKQGGAMKLPTRPPVPSPKAHTPRPPVPPAHLSHHQRVQATIDSSSIVTRKMDADSEDEEIDVVGLADSAPAPPAGSVAPGSTLTSMRPSAASLDDTNKRKAEGPGSALPAAKRPRVMPGGSSLPIPGIAMPSALARPLGMPLSHAAMGSVGSGGAKGVAAVAVGSASAASVVNANPVRGGRQPSAATLAAVAAAGGSCAAALAAVAAGGSGPMDTKTKRKFHNVLERKRRDDLNRSFQTLQKKIPDIKDSAQVAKVLILHKAVEYIGQLKRAESEIDAARKAASLEKDRLEARMSKLRALKAQQSMSVSVA